MNVLQPSDSSCKPWVLCFFTKNKIKILFLTTAAFIPLRVYNRSHSEMVFIAYNQDTSFMTTIGKQGMEKMGLSVCRFWQETFCVTVCVRGKL